MTERNQSIAQLTQARWSARICGVSFLGMQSAFGLREDLALFKSRAGSTISLPISKVNPLTLAYKIQETDALFRVKA